MSVRVMERASAMGPMTYEVHALWNVGNWRVKSFTSRIEADRYTKGLLEGLDACDSLNTIFTFNANDTPE